jgi:peptide/nickel transport system ATP-binding protein
VSLDVGQALTVGVVGESGSGKTTLARAILGLEPPTSGAILLEAEALPRTVGRRPRRILRKLQAVAQDPSRSLNPYLTVGESLRRPLVRLASMTRVEAEARIGSLLEDVGLPAEYRDRLPSQLSGGERQRVAIARAFSSAPSIVFLDEATSALDVSVQAGVLNLLCDLQRKAGTTYGFISHDLAVVAFMADRIVVMLAGRILEEGRTDEVLVAPYHPYTEALLASHPSSRRRTTGGRTQPVETSLPATSRGCPFAGRCPRQLGAVCATTPPPWRSPSRGHRIRCHHAVDHLVAVQASIRFGGAS